MLESTFLEDWDQIGTKMAICCLKVALIWSLSVFKGLKDVVSFIRRELRQVFLYFSIGYEGNFKKYSHGQVDRLGAPYDTTSLMHLPRNSWSTNGRNTIESRAGAHVVLGQMLGLSVVDKQQLNQLYKCKNNYGKKHTVFYQKILNC